MGALGHARIGKPDLPMVNAWIEALLFVHVVGSDE